METNHSPEIGPNALAVPQSFAAAGAAADAAARARLIDDYVEQLDDDTRERHRHDLRCYATYLVALTVIPPAALEAVATDLGRSVVRWHGTSGGLVLGFVRWMLGEGFAIGTINNRLSTVKRYCRLAMQAGIIDDTTFLQIQAVRGYAGRAARNIDAARGLSRLGAKKAAPSPLSEAQAARLKQQPITPQGRRDAVLLCLLIDHGLRVGELAALRIDSVDLARRCITFYREKVNKVQTHRLSPDTLRALRTYLGNDVADAPADAPLLRGSKKNGALHGTLSVRAIQARVAFLGQALGIAALSPHDLRHYWATQAARRPGVSITALRDAGGWSSLAMPNRYVAAQSIANEGLIEEEAGEG